MTNKLKATKQNFAVALVCCFIIKLQVFLIFYYATEQYFPVITFITLYEVVITFASSVGILSVTILRSSKHPNKSYCAVLSRCAVHYALQGVSRF